MANLVLYSKGSNDISYFIQDCIKDGNNFEGSNISLKGVKLHLFDYTWTNDDVKFNKNKFDKRVSELVVASSTENTHRNRPNRSEYKDALKMRESISNFDFKQIDNYVDKNVVDLDSAKDVLKNFGRIILSLCKEIDYKSK
ncbi:MAG: hypothetical protein ACE5RH_02665 [Nitrosarchaeum sp.]